jgi:AcrR family transcriptional regulator
MAKREKILDAAVKLFNNTHDIKKVSLEDIAAEAGVSPTTIYNNFGDRDNLVYEIVKNFVRVVLEQSRVILHSDLPFHQKLISIASVKMDMAGKAGC